MKRGPILTKTAWEVIIGTAIAALAIAIVRACIGG